MHTTRTAPATPCLPGADSNRDTQREAPGQGREHQQCMASKAMHGLQAAQPILGKRWLWATSCRSLTLPEHPELQEGIRQVLC